MASVLYMQPMTPSPPSNAHTKQTQRPALRRATYVHVSDLTSAYNIDHARLEQELSRVKAEASSGLAGRKVSGISPETVTAAATADEEESVGGVEPLADLEASLGAAAPQRRLQPPRGGFNLCVLVGTVNVVVDKRRVDQSRVRLAEVEIGDETGTASLRARDEQIDILAEVSSRSGAVVLRNCTLELYQGRHIRLAVTKWGKLATFPDNVASTPPPPSKMNLDRNFSLIDLSVVASEMIEPIQTPEISYPSRQSKQPETEAGGGGGGPASSSSSGGPGISSPSGRASASKAGQTHSKHQQQQTSRRSSRSNEQRRHSRGNKGPTAGGMTVHYGGIKQDSGQQQQRGQIIYHSLPGYPSGYEQTIDMRQYPRHTAYTQHTQHHDVSAQRLLMQQQYDLQQRQLHQMYGHGHQEHHHRQGHQSMQPPQMLLRPMGSFDTSTSSYVAEGGEQHQHQHIPLVQGVGTSPLLVPMGISIPHGMMSHPLPDQYSSPKLEGLSAGQDSRSSGAMSPFPIGKMNPDATAFAPSYGTPQGIQGATQGHGPRQFPYDPSQSLGGASYQTQAGHHAGFYSPGVMYPGAPNPRLTSPSENEGGFSSASGKAHRQQPPSTGPPDPETSGKENITSKP